MCNSIIKACDITKYYGKFKALENVSMTVNKGEIFSLLGANGAGKSTLIKLMIGLSAFEENDNGDIFINNKNIKEHTEQVRKIIGYVPEEKILIEDLTGEEYVDLMARLYKCNDENLAYRKNYLFNLFKLEDRKKHLIRFYSNGMKKRRN